MIEDFPSHIATLIQVLPDTPGVYQYYDKDNNLLYVGKAKNLKKRVSSYLNKDHDTARLNLMVKKINDIKSIKVDTELDGRMMINKQP